ncbi:zinc ribbon domain-containing protein [bacterium]|nr:zinc ribbon domain-containing protein [bacterium]
MPIFEYHCEPCGTTYESLQRSKDEEPDPCPSCGSHDVSRLLSVFSLRGATGGAEASSCARPGCAPRAPA